MTTDLEALRGMLESIKEHTAIGVITKLGLSQGNDALRVQVKLLPEEREIICIMGFSDVNDVTFPEINDLVIVAFVEDGHPESGHIIRLVNSEEELIPLFARTGHSVKYARDGKKLYLGSDTKVGIGKPGVEQTEPLVLGNVLKTFLTNLIDAFLNASEIGISAVGPVFLDPGIRVLLVQYKATYLTTAATNIESQIGFTERGA